MFFAKIHGSNSKILMSMKHYELKKFLNKVQFCAMTYTGDSCGA
jgi:hypothetical protein